MPDTQDWRAQARRELAREVGADSAELQREIAARDELNASIEKRRAAIQAKLDGARALGIELEPADFVPKGDALDSVKQVSGEPTAREIILDALRNAAPEPMKAAELRKVIQDRLGREIHYKTPGMSLYRLAEEGLVHREGHRWFAVTDDQRDAEDQQTEKEIGLMI